MLFFAKKINSSFVTSWSLHSFVTIASMGCCYIAILLYWYVAAAIGWLVIVAAKISKFYFVTSWSLHSFVTIASMGWTLKSRSVSLRMCPTRFRLNWKKNRLRNEDGQKHEQQHEHEHQDVPNSVSLELKEKKEWLWGWAKAWAWAWVCVWATAWAWASWCAQLGFAWTETKAWAWARVWGCVTATVCAHLGSTWTERKRDLVWAWATACAPPSSSWTVYKSFSFWFKWRSLLFAKAISLEPERAAVFLWILIFSWTFRTQFPHVKDHYGLLEI